MNHFEFGFFDELQKIATSSKELYELYRDPKMEPVLGKRGKADLGAMAHRDSQQDQRAPGGGPVSKDPTREARSKAPTADDVAVMDRAKRYAKVKAIRDARNQGGDMSKSAESGGLKKTVNDILSTPTGAPETIKDDLIDIALGLGGGFAGKRLARALGGHEDHEDLGKFVGATVGPAINAAIRSNKKLKEQGKKAKFSRAKAGAITGLIGAALGAAAPMGDGSARHRLAAALSLGIPAAAFGAGSPALFGTTKA
ncbi:MAG: hypothetical protein EBU84_04530 [Actinobacteria bacterium]|nr:hypothetical protein [Actinomycetota bacterium]